MTELTYYYRLADGSLSARTRTVVRTADNERSAPPVPAGATQLTADQYRIALAAFSADHTAQRETVRRDERTAKRLRPAGPARLVSGPVTDESVTDGPAVDGLMAVDTVNGHLYVRLDGAWWHTSLTKGQTRG